ncbi:DUF262 domain-containing protein [Sinorhizobium fredii]|uniref:DUF262 domain-containing protein n=1 Tax=Rhizobium fredii TaxID=380 RepID=UPI003517E19E
MQANPRTIDQLFNSQSRYIVPMFQRLYVWTENPQWQTLWEDIVEKATLQLDGVNTNAHYLGALIIEGVKPSSSREVKRLLVIDGQQRLTTMQLLLCAFRDIARSNEWKTLDRTTTRYLENADADVMEKPEEEVYKLWPTQLNRDVFSVIISSASRDVVEEKYPLIKLRRKRRPEPRPNLVEAYLFFYDQIEKWILSEAIARDPISEEDCAFALLQAIQQDFCVVEIALSEGDDSQEIFYSLNSQGRPLSQSDLLRSLIFMRAEKEREDRDALFNDFWGAFETDFWSFEVKRGGRTYSRLDLALRYFLTVKAGGLIDARRVNEEYKRWIASTPPRYPSVRAELADFSRYAGVFKKFEEPTLTRQKSTDIVRVLRDFDVSTALPVVLFLTLEAGLTEQGLSDCLAVVQSFIVRRAFTGEETKEYNKLFVELVGTLKGLQGADVQSALEQKLLSGGGTTRTWPSDRQVIEFAVNGPVYSTMKQSALRVILERLELALRGKKSEDEEISDGLQIEHVMPQTWYTHWPINGEVVEKDTALWSWTASDTQKHLIAPAQERARAVQTLGNLTLLNKYLNPAANNGPYEMKRREYSHSVLRLNRHFDGRVDWDEAAIADRGKQMGETICKIWPRPTAPEQD